MTGYSQLSSAYTSLPQLSVSTTSGVALGHNTAETTTVSEAVSSTPELVSNVAVTSPCCKTGRPVATDPVTGQVICSCQYDASSRLNLSNYPRGCPAVGVSVGGSVGGSSSLTYATNAGYPSSEHTPYPSIGVDSAAYFSQFTNPYGFKDPTADMGLYAPIGGAAGYGYNPYDPTIYAYGAPYDLAARRKNATRESTSTLKAWLNEHKKNPYPTKGEKIMLAIITKMTLTQVSTWFANARRRLKKENKMTWEPRNRTESDEDEEQSDKEDKHEQKELQSDSGRTAPVCQVVSPAASVSLAAPSSHSQHEVDEKPRIWSLADTASDVRRSHCSQPAVTGAHHPAAWQPAPTVDLVPDYHAPPPGRLLPRVQDGHSMTSAVETVRPAAVSPSERVSQCGAARTTTQPISSYTPPMTPPAAAPAHSADVHHLRPSGIMSGGCVISPSCLPSSSSAALSWQPAPFSAMDARAGLWNYGWLPPPPPPPMTASSSVPDGSSTYPVQHLSSTTASVNAPQTAHCQV